MTGGGLKVPHLSDQAILHNWTLYTAEVYT